MDPYVGEIRMWPSVRIPENWLLCDGRSLTVNDYQVLFAVIGTIYGGNGSTNFNIPNLIGRVPVHQGQGTSLTNRVIGQTGGEQAVTLTIANLPAHSHTIVGSTEQATTDTPGGALALAATASGTSAYSKEDATGKAFKFDANCLSSSGGDIDHNNVMPVISLNFIICTTGIFPQS